MEEVTTSKYLNAEITSDGNICKKVKAQITKATQIAGFLKDAIWSNKHMSVECKTRICKIEIRHIMTYAAKIRVYTNKSLIVRLMRTMEIRTIRVIQDITLIDSEGSALRVRINVQIIGKYVRNKKRFCDMYICMYRRYVQ
ncbi:hypothetical protein ABEB36_011357 [Hypothenemus hampei]|uniref:Uncharacterized protein n=1 Tax=Hypothenemus hampei TaxID=57062 RepID=A0ABD1EFH3_HYPHA